MANFDTNQWYHIYYNENKDTAMLGSILYDQVNQFGTSFWQTYNQSSPDRSHLWQFYLLSTEPSFYALRTKDSGGEGFLGTRFSQDEDTPGKTVPCMMRGNVSDDSVYWRVSPWGDGTFFLSNKANKTEWHLTRKSNSLSAMTSDITDDKPQQRLLFEAVSAINNRQFSSVVVSLAIAHIEVPADNTSASFRNNSNKNNDNLGAHEFNIYRLPRRFITIAASSAKWKRAFNRRESRHRYRHRTGGPYTAYCRRFISLEEI